MELKKNESKAFRVGVDLRIAEFCEVVSYLGQTHRVIPHRFLQCFLYLLEMDHYESKSDFLLGLTFVKAQPLFICELGELLLQGIDSKILKMISGRSSSLGLGYEVINTEYISGKYNYIDEDEGETIEERCFSLKNINNLLERINDEPISRLEIYCSNDIPIITEALGHRIEYQSVFYRTSEYSVKTHPPIPVKKVTDRLC